jgi:uncharacterized protein YbaA (DUF1428 family)
MAYLDGYVLPVPDAQRQAYEQMAATFDAVYRKHGALKVVEAWADDVPEGKLTSFPLAVKLEPGESVVFSFILWRDKATRDAGQAAFMEDPLVVDFDHESVMFDGKRMILGGFEVFLDL